MRHDQDSRWAYATAVLAGAGGRAVPVALMELGVAMLVSYDRDTARAVSLKADLAVRCEPSRCRIATDLEREVEAAIPIEVEAPCARYAGLPIVERGRICGAATRVLLRGVFSSSAPQCS